MRDMVVSICHPNYCFCGDLFVPYAYIVVRGITWLEETQFKDATFGDESLITSEFFISRKGGECSKRRMNVQRKEQNQNRKTEVSHIVSPTEQLQRANKQITIIEGNSDYCWKE
ncbi:hypothetical protein V8G54_026387 [Vigna mungo]|uniref:Uncharacterized protein n=1 Tax=Vigna mungo TaxID=3915 RepID=A0AAQ3RPF4_VIGMU